MMMLGSSSVGLLLRACSGGDPLGPRAVLPSVNIRLSPSALRRVKLVLVSRVGAPLASPWAATGVIRASSVKSESLLDPMNPQRGTAPASTRHSRMK
jgi:hypothetical protein